MIGLCVPIAFAKTMMLHPVLVQAQELSESNVKIGLLEKKLESSDMEMKRLADAEKDEVKKLKDQLERQKE